MKLYQAHQLRPGASFEQRYERKSIQDQVELFRKASHPCLLRIPLDLRVGQL